MVNKEINIQTLEEAAEEYAYRGIPDELKPLTKPLADEIIKNFIAGAEWQKQQDNNFERYKDYTDKALISLEEAREQGRQEMKAQMLKDAVEGEVIYDLGGFFRIKSEAIDGAKYKVGSWVKLIIVTED